MRTVCFIALQYILPQRLITWLMGKLARSEQPWLKNNFILSFKQRYKIDLSEALVSEATEHACFNDFFTRQLKPEARPIDSQTGSVVSVADGEISQFGSIDHDTLIQAKAQHFTLNALLGNDKLLSEKFLGGHFMTTYLSPKDYHRVHMPETGTLKKMTYVPGKLFSVNHATARHVPNLFARNERLICEFDNGQHTFVVILVGAMIVASIKVPWHGLIREGYGHKKQMQTWDYKEASQAITLQKGEEMGQFLLGSTTVCLWQKDAIQFDSTITCEQAIKMGESIGSSI